MKKIEVVVRVEKLDEIRMGLEKAGFIGTTVTEVKGRGAQKGVMLEWRAGGYRVEFLPKVKIDLVVKDADVDKAVDAIVKSARTGEIGDGKIFVTNVERVVRIRTGETGENAV